MKYSYLFIFFLLSLCSIAQTKTGTIRKDISGTVLDSITKEPVLSASVRLLNGADTTYVQGMVTDDKGKFKMTITKSGEYILEVSFLGYKSFFRNINTADQEQQYDLGDIVLAETDLELGTAVVEAQLPDIQVKGDTIQYNASAYNVEEHELLQDLIKKIPGIEIDNNGAIKANGKPITKILVDGKEFFGNDIAFALSNLPANMVKNLQLYKEQSEESKATGVKDQDPPQVLNLTVKEEFKKSIFGNARAGYGSDDRYSAGFNANSMHGNNQYTITGNMGNVMGDGRGIFVGNGENTSKNTGGNFNMNPSDKIEINGYVNYSYNKNLNINRFESYTSQLDRYSQGSSTYTNKGENINSNFSMRWNPDSLTTIHLGTNLGVNKNNNNSLSTDSSNVAGQDPTIGFSSNLNEDKGFSNGNSLMITRRFGKKGRSIRLNLGNTLRNNDTDGKTYSETLYPDDTPDRIIDNISKADNKNTSYGITLGYVEPLGEGKLLQFEYSYRQNDSKRINDARRMDDAGNYTIVDSTYTRDSRMKYRTHNINLQFQSNKEKYDYSIGFNMDPTYSDNKVTLGDSIIEYITQNTINFSPSLRLGYRPDKNTSWNFDYSGSTRQPATRELSGDTIVVNSLNKTVGNPDLRTSYSNRFSAYFMKSDFESGRFFNISFNFNYTLNDIVSYAVIDNKGNRFSTYRNVDGNMGSYIYATYNTPLRNKKFNISFDPNISYNKRIGYSNDEKSIIQNISMGPSANIRFTSDKFEGNLRAGASHNIAFNNLSEVKRSSNTRYNFAYGFKWKLPFDFSIKNDIYQTLLSGYGEGAKKSEFLWSASIDKLILKKKGTLQIQFADILNDRNNEQRSINGNDYSYSWSNTIGRYFLVSFSYRFHIQKGNKKKEEPMDDYYYDY
ncbi:MAG: outer membrane beta-barrel protein [Prevotella sp.]|jgi:hypothetical protein|nr:outer membrane beta-barrel protein [Prevotella sp.]